MARRGLLAGGDGAFGLSWVVTMAAPSELFSVVIAGKMNPPIHHPAWYRAVKILSPEETEVATAAPLICTPMISQFQAGGLAVLCTQERWEIQSQDPKSLDRILEIAGTAFDILQHTPVAAFGLNFHFLRPTGLQEVGKRLAELVNGLPLGRRAAASDSAVIVTTTTLPDRVLQETVSGVPAAAGQVRVSYNVHHPIKAPQPDKISFFELTPLLRAAFQEDYPECLGRAEEVAKALAGVQKE